MLNKFMETFIEYGKTAQSRVPEPVKYPIAFLMVPLWFGVIAQLLLNTLLGMGVYLTVFLSAEWFDVPQVIAAVNIVYHGLCAAAFPFMIGLMHNNEHIGRIAILGWVGLAVSAFLGWMAYPVFV